MTKGAFHYTKIFENFGPEMNGMLWSAWKFSGQNGRPPELVLLDRWSGLTETFSSTSKNLRFQSYFVKQQSKFRLNRKWIVSNRFRKRFLLKIPLAMNVWFGNHSLRCSRPTHALPGPQPLIRIVRLRISAQKLLCTNSQTLYTAV